MAECFRCGITFGIDLSKYRAGAPCEDCLYDVEGDWLIESVPGRAFPLFVQKVSDEDIRRLVGRNYTDREVAEELHVSPRTIQRRRSRLGLRGQPPSVGYSKIKDQERAKELARTAWERGKYGQR